MHAREGATTKDSILGGRVALVQPAKDRGYRVNVDAILLAEFAAVTRAERPARRAFDLGAGVGAVGLSLLSLGAAEHVTMVELDPDLAALAEVNARGNGWQDRVTVLAAGVLDAARAQRGRADLVVCNPPYVPPGRGRPPGAARALARSGDVGAFLDAARMLAGRRARACFVYPAIEVTTLLSALRARGLEPKRARFVHAKPTAPARVVLVECACGKPGGLVVEPPLVA